MGDILQTNIFGTQRFSSRMYKPLESDLDCIFILAGLLFFGIQEERQTLEKSTEKTLKSPQNC